MDVINFSDWHNEFVCQSPDIISVAHQLDKLRLQITNREDCSDSKCIVFRNVIHLLRQWTGNTYVGVNKSTELRQALQIFFKALYNLLIIMKNSDDREFHNIATEALYQGIVYRYLGYGSTQVIGARVIPIYDNIFVSWSKYKRVRYIEGKLHGPITHITCEISGDFYGIDLAAFGVGRPCEGEIVFPTIKKLVKTINYI